MTDTANQQPVQQNQSNQNQQQSAGAPLPPWMDTANQAVPQPEEPKQTGAQPTIEPIIEEPSVVSPNSKSKGTVKKLAISFLAVFLVIGGAFGSYSLIKKSRTPEILIQNNEQCQPGCNGLVCEADDWEGYAWCSKDTRCKCTGRGQAAPLDPQEWCDGDVKVKCGELPGGGCTHIAIPGDTSCGGSTPECDHYSDCYGVKRCVWATSTYCINRQCQCADVGAQQAYANDHPGWAICQDSAPQCTPDPCPSGWSDCGLGHARTDHDPACVKKTECNCGDSAGCHCSGCGNTYVVERWCKPGTSTQASPSPSPSPSPSLPPNPSLVCTNLSRSPVTELNVGDSVTFNCTGAASLVTINHYEFRLSSDGGATYSVISNNSTTGTTSYTIANEGDHVVQCRVCSSANSVNCTAWGQAGGWVAP